MVVDKVVLAGVTLAEVMVLSMVNADGDVHFLMET